VILYFDDRWIGAHGIGRFARELDARLRPRPLRLRGSPASPLDPLRLGAACLRLPRDSMLLNPGYNPPLVSRVPYAICVHDLNHLDRPDNASAAKTLYYRAVLAPRARRAHAVLTVSEFSRGRIVESLGVPAERVVNVGNGVSEVFTADGPRHAAGGDYVLCVGNRKGHKNEPALLRAFASSGLHARLRLVLTGRPTPALDALATQLGIAGALSYAGEVTEEGLAALYRGALFLAFPSLYEGFGLPVVEAFACGTPVLTSSTTSLPEIARDAAVLVDPASDEAIAQGLRRLADSPALRAELAARGRLRARSFTWDTVAARVRAALGLPDPQEPTP
jgi:glycosyltransferase involved in cell wall biosynthesis